MKRCVLLFFFCLSYDVFSVVHVDLWRFIEMNLTNPHNATVLEYEQALSDAYFRYQVPLDDDSDLPTSNVSGDDSYGLEMSYRYGGSYSYSGNPRIEDNRGSSSVRLSKKIPFLFGQDIFVSYSESFSDKHILPDTKNYTFSSLSISGQLPFFPSKIKYLIYQKHRLFRDYELARLTYVTQIESHIRSLVDTYFKFSLGKQEEVNMGKLVDDQKNLFEVMKLKYDMGKVPGVDYLSAQSDYLKQQHDYNTVMINQDMNTKDVYHYLNVEKGETVQFDEVIDYVINMEPFDYYLSRLEYNKDYIRLLFDLDRIEHEMINIRSSIIDDASFSISKPLDNDTERSENFSVSFGFSLPILDQRVRQKRIHNSEQQYHHHVVKIQDFIETYKKELFFLYDSILLLKASNVHMSVLLEVSKKRYEASLARYKKGMLTYIELNQAIDLFKQAHKDVLDHQKSLFLNYYDLLCKSGLFVLTEGFMDTKRSVRSE